MGINKYLFSSALAIAEVTGISAQRIDEISRMSARLTADSLNQGVIVKYDETIKTPALVRKESEGYVITYNPLIVATLSQSAVKLISYHEMSHILLGHSDMDPELKIRKTVEFEADILGALLFKKFENVDEDIFQFISLIQSQTATVPPGTDRAEVFKLVFTTKM